MQPTVLSSCNVHPSLFQYARKSVMVVQESVLRELLHSHFDQMAKGRVDLDMSNPGTL